MLRAAADRVVSFEDMYDFLKSVELFSGADHAFSEAWALARADSFAMASYAQMRAVR